MRSGCGDCTFVFREHLQKNVEHVVVPRDKTHLRRARTAPPPSRDASDSEVQRKRAIYFNLASRPMYAF